MFSLSTLSSAPSQASSFKYGEIPPVRTLRHDNDKSPISPWNIKPYSSTEVMRMKYMISTTSFPGLFPLKLGRGGPPHFQGEKKARGDIYFLHGTSAKERGFDCHIVPRSRAQVKNKKKLSI